MFRFCTEGKPYDHGTQDSYSGKVVIKFYLSTFTTKLQVGADEGS